jgi:hypothetical protein
MNKLRWDPHGRSLSLVWSTPYGEKEDDQLQAPGRLGGGSGTTPTIIGNKKEGRMVVICDGAPLMHVMFFDCENGRVLSRTPVTFGNDSVQFTTTEQSVTGHGYRVMVTSNDYRYGARLNTR